MQGDGGGMIMGHKSRSQGRCRTVLHRRKSYDSRFAPVDPASKYPASWWDSNMAATDSKSMDSALPPRCRPTRSSRIGGGTRIPPNGFRPVPRDTYYQDRRRIEIFSITTERGSGRDGHAKARVHEPGSKQPLAVRVVRDQEPKSLVSSRDLAKSVPGYRRAAWETPARRVTAGKHGDDKMCRVEEGQTAAADVGFDENLTFDTQCHQVTQRRGNRSAMNRRERCPSRQHISDRYEGSMTNSSTSRVVNDVWQPGYSGHEPEPSAELTSPSASAKLFFSSTRVRESPTQGWQYPRNIPPFTNLTCGVAGGDARDKPQPVGRGDSNKVLDMQNERGCGAGSAPESCEAFGGGESPSCAGIDDMERSTQGSGERGQAPTNSMMPKLGLDASAAYCSRRLVPTKVFGGDRSAEKNTTIAHHEANGNKTRSIEEDSRVEGFASSRHKRRGIEAAQAGAASELTARSTVETPLTDPLVTLPGEDAITEAKADVASTTANTAKTTLEVNMVLEAQRAMEAMANGRGLELTNKARDEVSPISRKGGTAQDRTTTLACSTSEYQSCSHASHRVALVAAERLSGAEASGPAAESRVEAAVWELKKTEPRPRKNRESAEEWMTRVGNNRRGLDASEAASSDHSHGAACDTGVLQVAVYDVEVSKGTSPERDIGGTSLLESTQAPEGSINRHPVTTEAFGSRAWVDDRRRQRMLRGGINSRLPTCLDLSTATQQQNHRAQYLATCGVGDPSGASPFHGRQETSNENIDTDDLHREKHMRLALQKRGAPRIHEVEAVSRRVADAEREAAGLRIDLHGGKAGAVQMTTEAAPGKEQEISKSERLSREVAAADHEVCVLRATLEGACRGGHEGSRGRVESRIETLASAFEEDLACDTNSESTSCCEVDGPRPVLSQAGTRRLSEGECLKTAVGAVIGNNNEIEEPAAIVGWPTEETHKNTAERAGGAFQNVREAGVKGVYIRTELDRQRFSCAKREAPPKVAGARAVKEHRTLLATTASAAVSAAGEALVTNRAFESPCGDAEPLYSEQPVTANTLPRRGQKSATQAPRHPQKDLFKRAESECTSPKDIFECKPRNTSSTFAKDLRAVTIPSSQRAVVSNEEAAAIPLLEKQTHKRLLERSGGTEEAGNVDAAASRIGEYYRPIEDGLNERVIGDIAEAKDSEDSHGSRAGMAVRETVTEATNKSVEGKGLRKAAAEVLGRDRDLDRARPAAQVAEGQGADGQGADGQIVDLQAVVAEPERHSAILKERGEAGLEPLKLALTQEQKEGATSQSTSITQLSEIFRAEARAAGQDRRLAEATQIRHAGQHDGSRLRADLERHVVEINTNDDDSNDGSGDVFNRRCASKSGTATLLTGCAAHATGTFGSSTAINSKHSVKAVERPVKMPPVALEVMERLAEAGRALQDSRIILLESQKESAPFDRRLNGVQTARDAESRDRRQVQAGVLELERTVEDSRCKRERARKQTEARFGVLNKETGQEELDTESETALESTLDEKTTAEKCFANLKGRSRQARDTEAATASGGMVVFTNQNGGFGSASATDCYVARRNMNNAEGFAREMAGDDQCNDSRTATRAANYQELLGTVEIVQDEAQDEVSFLRSQFETVQVAQAATMEKATREKRALVKIIAELEAREEDTKTKHYGIMKRVESSLETLRMAFEQEEEEQGTQSTLVVLLQEKEQAEKRAAEAALAMEACRSWAEQALEQADAVVRAAEREAEALREELDGRSAREAEDFSKLYELSAAFLEEEEKGGIELVAVESSYDQENNDHIGSSDEYQQTELQGRVCKALITAKRKVMNLSAEIERVKFERNELTEFVAAEARKSSAAAAAKAMLAAQEQSNVARKAETQAAERATMTETAPPCTEAALQVAEDKTERLTRNPERARVDEATVRAASSGEKKAIATDKIGQLERTVGAAVSEHERSREREETELQELRAILKPGEGAGADGGTKNPEGIMTDESTEFTAGARVEVEPEAERDAEAKEVAVAPRLLLGAVEDKLEAVETNVEEEAQCGRQQLSLLKGEEVPSIVQTEAAARITELEGSLEAAEQGHELFRKGMHERLEELGKSLEEEDSGDDVLAALTTSLSENATEKRLFAEVARISEKERSDLEHCLKRSTDALREAKEKVRTLDLTLDQAIQGIAGQRSAATPAREAGTAGEVKTPTAVGRSSDSQVTSRMAATFQCALGVAKEPFLQEPSTSQEEALCSELYRAREAGWEAKIAVEAAKEEERKCAVKRVAELEDEIKRAEKQRERTRLRAEARLEDLVKTFEQGEREIMIQTTLTKLRSEKSKTEESAAGVELNFEEASTVVRTAQATVVSLRSQLELAKRHHTAEKRVLVALKQSGEEKSTAEASQASKRVAEAEAVLATASNSADEARAENEALRDKLERARQQEREATEASETAKQAAQERIAELESATQETQRGQTLSKKRVERRLRRFKLAIDEEEQGCRTALAALLEEKTDAETKATDLTQAIINIGSRLEVDLRKVNEAFRVVAKSAGATTKEDLGEIHVAFNACAVLAAANGTAEALVAAAVATGAERQSALVFAKENDIAAAKRIKAVELQSARGVVTALVEKEEPERASDERHRDDAQAFEALSRGRIRGVEHEEGRLREEIGVGRATEATATDDVKAARSEILTLRSAMKGSDREHLKFRERMETRLDNLKRAVEMEERENGAKAAIACLLYERDHPQARVEDVEAQLLAQAHETNRAIFDDVGDSKTKLDPRGRRDAEILSSGTIRATATGVAETGEGRSFEVSVKNRAWKVERAIWNSEERVLYDERGEIEKRKREGVHPLETTGLRDSEGEFFELDPIGAAVQPQARKGNFSADEGCKIDGHGAALTDYKDPRGPPREGVDEATAPREGQGPGNDESMALLRRGKVAARLEGLRASVVEEEEEAGVQAAMVALLDEKFRAESRANDLEWKLLQVLNTVGAADFEGTDPGRMPSSSPFVPKRAVLAAGNAVGARFAETATRPTPFHGAFGPTKHLKMSSTRAQAMHLGVHQEVPTSEVVELAHKINASIQDVPESSGEEIPPAGIFASESQENGHKRDEESRQFSFYKSLEGVGTPAGVVELLAERNGLPREKERLRLETDEVSLARKRAASLWAGQNELMLDISRDDREETRKQISDSAKAARARVEPVEQCMEGWRGASCQVASSRVQRHATGQRPNDVPIECHAEGCSDKNSAGERLDHEHS